MNIIEQILEKVPRDAMIASTSTAFFFKKEKRWRKRNSKVIG